MARVSLKDRKRLAIEAEAAQFETSRETDVVAPPSSPATQAEPSTPASSVKIPKPPKAQSRAALSATTRVGIYFRDAEFDRAKAAYLSDWQHGGQADTFARWIAGAIDLHAARDPQERAKLERPQREGEGSGGSRSFSLPSDAVDRMRKAIVADQQTNRWPTASAWSGDAIAAAVGAAEAAAGGSLPPAPARLPNRLSR